MLNFCLHGQNRWHNTRSQLCASFFSRAQSFSGSSTGGAFRVRALGHVLEAPGNLTGPKSYFEIKVSRKVGCVLTSNEVHFVSLADNFTVQFSNLLKLPLEWKTKQLNGPGNYRELRETGPWPGTLCCVLGQDTTLTVPLSTQVYKWVPVNLMLGGNPAMD